MPEQKEKDINKWLGLPKIQRHVKIKLIMTIALLAKLISSGVNIQRQTVQRTLHHGGLHGHRLREIPFL